MAAFCESVAVMALNAEGASMHMFRCGSWLAGASCAGTLFLATGGAAVAGSADDWQYSGTLYLWGAGINAETARGSTVDIDFTTLLNNLNMAAMGALEARRREWSFVADAIYLNVGGDNEASVPVFGSPWQGRVNGWLRNSFDQPPRYSSSWPVPWRTGVLAPST